MEKEDWRVKELRFVILHWRNLRCIREILNFQKKSLCTTLIPRKLIDVVRDLNNEKLYADDSLYLRYTSKKIGE